MIMWHLELVCLKVAMPVFALIMIFHLRRQDFRWVTTLEAFDFYGRNRIDDHRLHLKWLNKII